MKEQEKDGGVRDGSRKKISWVASNPEEVVGLRSVSYFIERVMKYSLRD